MKSSSLAEMKNIYLGKIGSKDRDQCENEMLRKHDLWFVTFQIKHSVI